MEHEFLLNYRFSKIYKVPLTSGQSTSFFGQDFYTFFSDFRILSILKRISKAHLSWDFDLNDSIFPIALIFMGKDNLNLCKRSLDKILLASQQN